MSKGRVYIAGPTTGYPDLNRAAFAEAAERLRGLGWEVMDPCGNGIPDEEPRSVHLRADIRLLLDCDAIHLLPGWQFSIGASLEWTVALHLGLLVVA